MAEGWTGRGKVRARAVGGGVEIAIEGITTQARYYKPLVYEFFRKEFPTRPRWGSSRSNSRWNTPAKFRPLTSTIWPRRCSMH
jgi:hypothetical protein